MSEPNASTPQAGDVPIEPDIQFDQAEYATEVPSGPTCAFCKRAIDDEYYEINAKLVCASCRQGADAALRGGSRALRFLKAFFLGSVAAVIGAVIYYAILRITGLNIGLVAVVVGALVGGAVRKGTGNRGGLVYQLLAVFLAYSAIVAMHVPFVFEGFAKAREANRQAKVATEKVATDAAKAPAQLKAPLIVANEPPKPSPKAGDHRGPAAPANAPAADSAERPKGNVAVVKNGGDMVDEAVPAAKEPAAVVMMGLVALVFLIGILYTIPVHLAIGDPISGLIFCFAIWTAWQTNKRAQWSFAGPFRVHARDSNELALGVDDGG